MKGILYSVQFGCVLLFHIVISSLSLCIIRPWLKLFSKECGSSKAEKMSKFSDDLEYLMASTNFHEKVVHGKKVK